jgi:hypothetical protein
LIPVFSPLILQKKKTLDVLYVFLLGLEVLGVDGGAGDDVVFEDGVELLDSLDVLGFEELREGVGGDLGEGFVGGGEDSGRAK